MRRVSLGTLVRGLHPLDIALGVCALGWFLYVSASAWSGELIAGDDAFISFQYARNLARGLGLVFNTGERIWGFTSPLQTVILGALTSVGFETVRAGFVTGFLWVAMATVLLYGLAVQVLPRVLALALSLYFLLDPSRHGDYTLESNLLVAAQLAFVLTVVHDKGRTANILGALSCLVRPDSLLLVVPVLLTNREARKPQALAWFVAVGALWEGFALLYYGTLLPNSFHAKVGLTSFWPFLMNALRYVTEFSFAPQLGFAAEPVRWQRLLVLVLGGLALLNRNVRRRLPIAYCLVVFPWLLLLAYSVIGSYSGHNWEFYSARYFLGVAAVVGLLSLGQEAATRLRLPREARRGAVLIVLAFALVNGALRTREQAAGYRTANTDYWLGRRYETYRNIAYWVNHNVPRGSTFAISEVGTFGYYTDLYIIDVSGIVTRGYAPNERMKHDKFLLRFKPHYALLYGNVRTMVLSPSLSYQRIAYFPDNGFNDFSLMTQLNNTSP